MFNSRIPVCHFLSLMSLLIFCQEWVNGKPLPGLRSKRWDACIGLPSLGFPYGESDLWPSFDMDCLLALWPLLFLVSLVMCKVWSFDLYLKKLPCNTVYILRQSSIKHPCSTRDLGLRVLLYLFISLSGWFSGVWKPAVLIFLPGLSRPLKTSWEGTLCLREWYKPCPRVLLVFCVTQGILTSFFLSLSYCQLWTTRFRSIKGLQPLHENFIQLWILSDCKLSFLAVSIVSHLFAMKWWDWMPWS